MTPGPWKLSESEKPNCLGTFTVFYGPHAPARDNQICQADTLANARLIAGAPDLLAACERTLEILDAWGPERRGDTLERLHERLTAAIRRTKETA